MYAACVAKIVLHNLASFQGVSENEKVLLLPGVSYGIECSLGDGVTQSGL